MTIQFKKNTNTLRLHDSYHLQNFYVNLQNTMGQNHINPFVYYVVNSTKIISVRKLLKALLPQIKEKCIINIPQRKVVLFGKSKTMWTRVGYTESLKIIKTKKNKEKIRKPRKAKINQENQEKKRKKSRINKKKTIFPHSYIPSFLHFYFHTFLNSYLPTFLHSYISTFLHF